MGRTILSVGLQPCDNEEATMDFLEEPMHIVDVNSQPVEVRPRVHDSHPSRLSSKTAFSIALSQSLTIFASFNSQSVQPDAQESLKVFATEVTLYSLLLKNQFNSVHVSLG